MIIAFTLAGSIEEWVAGRNDPHTREALFTKMLAICGPAPDCGAVRPGPALTSSEPGQIRDLKRSRIRART